MQSIVCKQVSNKQTTGKCIYSYINSSISIYKRLKKKYGRCNLMFQSILPFVLNFPLLFCVLWSNMKTIKNHIRYSNSIVLTGHIIIILAAAVITITILIIINIGIVILIVFLLTLPLELALILPFTFIVVNKFDIKKPDCNIFIQYSIRRSRRRNIPGGE